MYIVVMGYGEVGYHLARALLAIGHEVLIIERDPLRCEAIREELGSIALHGDGSEVPVQKKAGLARADAFIAAGGDADNLAACQIAKHVFSTPKTVALVSWPENEALFKTLGVDVVINGTNMVLSTIEEELPGRSLLHLTDLKSGGKKMVSISIPQDATTVGRPLEEIELPPNSFISLLVTGDGPHLPSDDLVLHPEDEVIAVTTPDEEQLLHEMLTGIG